MTSPCQQCDQVDDEPPQQCFAVPDVLYDYLYARSSGASTYYDVDFDVPVRTFENH